MVKSTKEQKKARREERAWNTWLWGAKGNAVWDESGRTALRIDQALRQNARAAAADVSQVESEQFAWQAGRWGHQPSSAQGDGELLKAALQSLGSCSLREIQETVRSSTSESDSKSQSSGDESEGRASSKISNASGTFGGRHGNSACSDVSECRKCGCRASLSDGTAQSSPHGSVSQCQCKLLRRQTSHRNEHQEDKGGLASVLTTQTTWPMYSFGAERPIHCSCLWNSERSGDFMEVARKKRLGNLSPVDRVSDDVL